MRIREEQLTGTLEALVVQPLSSFELAVGLVGFPFLFAMLRALAYLGIAWAWLDVDLSRADWSGVALVFVSSGLALTSLGIALGAIVLVIKRGDVLASLGVFALGLISGSLFPISVLPGWLEPLAKIAPMRFAFDGLRSTLYRGSGWGEDVVILALLGAFNLPDGCLDLRSVAAVRQAQGLTRPVLIRWGEGYTRPLVLRKGAAWRGRVRMN